MTVSTCKDLLQPERLRHLENKCILLTDHVFLQITQHVKNSNSFYCVYSTYP